MRRLSNVRLPSYSKKFAEEKLWRVSLNQQNCITAIDLIPTGSAMSGEDWKGDWLSPMAIDLQVNGGLGIAFTEITNKDLPQLSKLMSKLWCDGVEGICPTIITCELKQLRQALSVLKEARKQTSPKKCKILGAHLEGPFIAPERCGAHPPEHICSPQLESLRERIDGFETDISLMTIAPELDGSKNLIKHLDKNKIVVCLGHSSANEKTCSILFKEGVKMITHTFNAMPGLNKRAPGPIGAALNNEKISMGLIADGVHVDPTIAVCLQKLAPKQIVLISDALSPYGLNDGVYNWDQRDLFVKNGTCRLKDATLAGTTLPLLEGCKRLAKWSGNPGAAIWATTVAPRKVLCEELNIHNLLLGKSLKSLLRWTSHSEGENLNWHFAD